MNWVATGLLSMRSGLASDTLAAVPTCAQYQEHTTYEGCDATGLDAMGRY